MFAPQIHMAGTPSAMRSNNSEMKPTHLHLDNIIVSRDGYNLCLPARRKSESQSSQAYWLSI